MWANLTVYEHLNIWNQLKGGVEDKAAIDRLIEKCDLTLKRNDFAKTLSGGMKRKLQLACMLIGGSSVCLLDEVTSGLDPLSRRAIWNVILSERSHRTMILTTHFLDEAEVLADHVMILSLGNTKCQGSPAQLKTQYGGGYHVSLPKTVDVSHLSYPIGTKEDQYICTVPDSKTAVQVLSGFRNLGNSQACITGPTIEDVFLRVSDDSQMHADSELQGQRTTLSEGESVLLDRMPRTRVQSFLAQYRALLLKRLIILRSQWWIYLFALVIPIAFTYPLGEVLMDYDDYGNRVRYEIPKCGRSEPDDPYMVTYDFYISPDSVVIGPQSANKSMVETMEAMEVYFYEDYELPTVRDSRESLVKTVEDHTSDHYGGAVFASEDETLVMIPSGSWNMPYAPMSLLNVANQARSGVNLTGSVGRLRKYEAPGDYGLSTFYIIMLGLLQTVYPAFFAIYPTYERRNQIRALQYSNGVRPAPLLAAYLTFDFMFVVVVSAACTAIMTVAAPVWGIAYMFPVFLFYGMAATMFVYLVSRMARSQPGAFPMSFLLSGLMYAIAIISVTVSSLSKCTLHLKRRATDTFTGYFPERRRRQAEEHRRCQLRAWSHLPHPKCLPCCRTGSQYEPHPLPHRWAHYQPRRDHCLSRSHPSAYLPGRGSLLHYLVRGGD